MSSGSSDSSDTPDISQSTEIQVGHETLPFPVEWTVRNVTLKIRDALNISGGYLALNGVVLDDSDLVNQRGKYTFLKYKRLATTQAGELSWQTAESSDIRSFWQVLYDTGLEDLPVSQVLSVGPLLHRKNELEVDIAPHLFVRDVYSRLFDLCCGTRHFYFTGTPGIGKSCFRTYMMWRHIQQLKHTGGTGFIWAGKCPAEDSMVHGLYIKDGQIVDAYKIRSSYSDLAKDWLRSNFITSFAHLDVSLGDVSAAPTANNFTNFYYTSPNEKAWKDQCAFSGNVMCLPEWSTDELVQYYCGIGCNGVLLRRLLQQQHDIEEEKHFKLCISSDPHSEPAENTSHVVHVSEEQLKRVIEEETTNYGYVPRNLFLSNMKLKAFAKNINSGIMNLEKTALTVELTGFMMNVRHRLLSINPKPFPADFSEYSTKWTGAFVYNAVVQHILKTYARDVESNFFSGQLHSIFQGDPKMFEILSLGCFALYPEHFEIHPILFKRAKENVEPPAIVSKDIHFPPKDSENLNDLNVVRGLVRSATNLEMEEFAGDITRSAIVSPLNQQYAGIDGIARFEYKGTIYTAFVQVTIAEKHALGQLAVDLLLKLKNLAETAAAERTVSHKCIFMWLIDSSTTTRKVKLQRVLTNISMINWECTLTSTLSMEASVGALLLNVMNK